MIKEDLKATADLAHLDLGEAELDAALPAFEQMLGYFAAMRAADADEAAFGIASSSSDLSRQAAIGRFRADAPANNNNFANNNPENNPSNNSNGLSGLADVLLNAAGERDGRFVVVPNVL